MDMSANGKVKYTLEFNSNAFLSIHQLKCFWGFILYLIRYVLIVDPNVVTPFIFKGVYF